MPLALRVTGSKGLHLVLLLSKVMEAKSAKTSRLNSMPGLGYYFDPQLFHFTSGS